MKITIDTREDSPEEIRKLIRMLSALIGDSEFGSQRTPPASGEGLFNIFGDPAASTAEQRQLGGGGGSADVNDFIYKTADPDKTGSSDDDMKVVPY